jgi:nucleoside-diphosphate-sugar epimerase
VSAARRAEGSPGEACLVTGASGFIGGALVRRLAGAGRTVRCVVRESSDTSALARLDVELVVGDLTQPSSLARAVRGCREVVHCGALVSDWATVREIVDTNVHGTRALLEAAAGAPVERFVHISSTDVYGYPGAREVEETCSATRFRNWYAQSKLDAETEVRRAQALHGLDVAIVRPATVYGPGSKEVVGEIARAIRGGHMLLIDAGRAIAGLCYVENLLDAISLALERDAARGQAFNVSDGLAVTWSQLAGDLAAGLGCPPPRWSVPYWLAHALGFALERGYRALRASTGLHCPPLLSRQAVHVLGVDQSFSNRKARELLGWRPRVGYEDGLAATLAWLRGIS